MATYLLDTNIVIHIMRGEERSVRLVSRLLEAGHTLATCGIVAAEVYAGMRPKDAQATKQLLGSLSWFDMDVAVAEGAGLMRRDFSANGITLSLADCLIASASLVNGAILVTENVRDFPAKGLAVLGV